MKRLWSSPTLRSMIIYGAAGAGFALANLILARELSKEEYAIFTLVIALGNLGFALAPLGAEDIVNRRTLEAGPRLLTRVLRFAAPIALGFAVAGVLVYDLTFSLAVMLGISVVAGAAMMVAAGQFQSEHRFVLALSLTQSKDVILLVAALGVVMLGWQTAWPTIFISTLGFLVTAVLGWSLLFRERHTKPARDAWFPWREALALAGVNAAGLLLTQLERLIAGKILPVADLATYGVLAATVGSPFRVLQMGVGYALIPRLRAAQTPRERRRLVAEEAMLAGGIAVLGAIAVILVTPLVERYVLDGKYHLGAALLTAAIISGVTKLLNAFTKAAVTALAEPNEVWALNLLSWLSIGVAILASVIAVSFGFGLVGVIYGVSLGWLVRAVSSFYVTARHLRSTPAEAVVAPPEAAGP